jgi:hypothetical protein
MERVHEIPASRHKLLQGIRFRKVTTDSLMDGKTDKQN